MRHQGLLAAIGAAALIPAAVLIAGGLTDTAVPGLLVHPVLVMGGLALAIGAALYAATRVEVQSVPEGFRVACTIRRSPAPLTVLALGVLLLGVIAVYLFLENFTPR
jgi:hypothetical protein